MEWDVPSDVLPGLVHGSRVVLGRGPDALIWLSYADAFPDGLVFHVRLELARSEEIDRQRWHERLAGLGVASARSGEESSVDVDFWILTGDGNWVRARVSDPHVDGVEQLTFVQRIYGKGSGPDRASVELSLLLSPLPELDGVTLRTRWVAADIETSQFELPMDDVRTAVRRARRIG